LAAVAIGIFFAGASAILGITSVSTPSLRSLLAWAVSMPSGSVNVRVKLPNWRSYV
jgi:hypothetical protein